MSRFFSRVGSWSALLATFVSMVSAFPRVTQGVELPSESASAEVRRPSGGGEKARWGTIVDVGLSPDGELVGRVLNAQGDPQADQKLELIQDKRVIATPISAADGAFRIGHLRGGVYQIRSGLSAVTFRAWSPGAAPPSAASHVNLVEGVARGQGCTTASCTTPGCEGECEPATGATALWKPILLISAVAAAIAIPLALNDDDNGASN